MVFVFRVLYSAPSVCVLIPVTHCVYPLLIAMIGTNVHLCYMTVDTYFRPCSVAKSCLSCDNQYVYQ